MVTLIQLQLQQWAAVHAVVDIHPCAAASTKWIAI